MTPSMTPSISPSSENTLLSLNQVRAMLAARASLIIRVVILTAVLTGLLLMVIPRAWTSTSDVFVDYQENDPINGQSFSALLDDSYMQTQMDMIHSQAVADKMIRTLGLLDLSNPNNARAHAALLAYINQHLEVTKNQSSRVLNVSFTAETPQKARDYANAIVNAYITVSQDISSSTARARALQYTTQLNQLRRDVDTAQDNLTRYRQQTGIIDADQDSTIDIRNLNDMTSQMLTLTSKVEQAQATNDTEDQLLKSGVKPEDLPQIGEIVPLNDLRNGLTVVDHQLGQLGGSLGPNHPEIRGLLAQHAQMQAEINRQAQAALQAQQSQLISLKDQKAALQNDINAQRAKVLDLLAKRDQIDAYNRQLTASEQVYRAALQKYDGILMASTISLPSVTVLRAAETPTAPSRPRVQRSLGMGIVVGIMAGLALALLLELAQRRVRCTDDLLRNSRIPVIGRIGRRSQAMPSATL